MSVYVALLRGVNVGGRGKLEMATLKTVFEKLGCTDVRTYVNSGNVVFRDKRNAATLTQLAEEALGIRLAIRDLEQMRALSARIPADWANDSEQKTDIAFVLDEPREELWHALREDIEKGKPIGTLDVPYTARNVNTVRKLTVLMEAL